MSKGQKVSAVATPGVETLDFYSQQCVSPMGMASRARPVVFGQRSFVVVMRTMDTFTLKFHSSKRLLCLQEQEDPEYLNTYCRVPDAYHYL